MTNIITSFYIPRMLIAYSEEHIKSIFANYLCIGDVNRVDFVPIEGDSRFQKAFVHMNQTYDTPFVSKIFNDYNNNKNVRVYPNLIKKNEYWILLNNKIPVSETKLNIHQVVENARILQSVVEKQAEEIKVMREQLLELTKSIEIDNFNKNQTWMPNEYEVEEGELDDEPPYSFDEKEHYRDKYHRKSR